MLLGNNCDSRPTPRAIGALFSGDNGDVISDSATSTRRDGDNGDVGEELESPRDLLLGDNGEPRDAGGVPSSSSLTASLSSVGTTESDC